MANDCIDRLINPDVKKALFGDREMPDAAIRKMLEGVNELKKAFDQGHLDEKEFNRGLQKYIEDRKFVNEADQRIKLGDKEREIKRRQFRNQPGFKGKDTEAFLAQLTKSTTLANEGRVSVESMGNARLESYGKHVEMRLKEKGLFGAFLTGQLDDDIEKALHSINTKSEASGISTDAMDIAKVVKEVTDVMFADKREAGLPVQYLKNRTTLQTHDAPKLAAAGFDKWAQDVMRLQPNKELLGPTSHTPEGMQKILKGIYDDINAGKYGNVGTIQDGELVDVNNPARISSKTSKNRVLQFDSPEARNEYRKTYGQAQTLSEALFVDMSRTAKAVSMFEKFGDKPREALVSDIDKQIALLKSSGDEKGATKLEGNRNRILNAFDQVAGATSVPGNATLAKIGKGIAALESASKLGNLGIRSMANTAGAIVEMQSTGGLNMLESIGKTTSEFVKTLPEGASKTFIADQADYVKYMMGQINARINGDGAVGKLSTMADLNMKYLGQDLLNQTAKDTVAYIHQTQWGKYAGKDFSELPTQLQSGLLQAGITKDDFTLFGAAREVAPNGKAIVTPEGIAALSDDQVAAVMGVQGIKGNPSNYRRGLEYKLRSFLIQSADIATTTAGARESSRLNFGTQSGTPEGEFMRLLTRFKSFTLQSLNIAKTFLNANPDKDLLAKGILASQGNAYGYMGQWVIMGGIMAYGADSLIRMSQGKEMKDPRDPETWLDSVAKSGSGGMYVDFFAGEWDKYDFGASLLGPTLGNVAQVAKIGAEIKRGNDTDFMHRRGYDAAKADATRLVRGYIPFQQAVGVKNALDYVQTNYVNEMLNPGSRAKAELRAARQKYAEERR